MLDSTAKDIAKSLSQIVKVLTAINDNVLSMAKDSQLGVEVLVEQRKANEAATTYMETATAYIEPLPKRKDDPAKLELLVSKINDLQGKAGRETTVSDPDPEEEDDRVFNSGFNHLNRKKDPDGT